MPKTKGPALPPGTDPEALHARLTARRAREAELAERRAELARAAEGQSEADLRAERAALTGDDIEVDSLRAVPGVGSDHARLVVELGIPDPLRPDVPASGSFSPV